MLKALAPHDGSSAQDDPSLLRSWYGARPDEEFVRDNWDILRERWLSRDTGTRKAIVERLCDLGVGEGTDYPCTKATEMEFLRSCRNARRLRQMVLDMFIELGEEPRSNGAPLAATQKKMSFAEFRHKHWSDTEPQSSKAKSRPSRTLESHPISATRQQPEPASAGAVRQPTTPLRKRAPVPDEAIKNHGAFIWSVADLLRGDYKPHEYGKVILPLTVLRRLDCVLEATKGQVLQRAERLKGVVENIEPVLCQITGHDFYNRSPLDLRKVLDDPSQVAGNLRGYIAQFSPAARDILDKFDFDTQITRLDKANLLYLVVGKFVDLDLHPQTVSNLEMGYL
ncbi:MAG TPA: type I restriction-modification system subunit M N-terminal domain-containing protein, partial [Acidimicrobiales bacterium]|nr:type I restriction-modification system subunit M N-terminal domain-containing protein [Acidimicrobiales bacterium]